MRQITRSTKSIISDHIPRLREKGAALSRTRLLSGGWQKCRKSRGSAAHTRTVHAPRIVAQHFVYTGRRRPQRYVQQCSHRSLSPSVLCTPQASGGPSTPRLGCVAAYPLAGAAGRGSVFRVRLRATSPSTPSLRSKPAPAEARASSPGLSVWAARHIFF